MSGFYIKVNRGIENIENVVIYKSAENVLGQESKQF